MQTQINSNISKHKYPVSLPDSLKPKMITGEAIDFVVASQHPIIGVWLVFSLFSIGVLSVLLYTI